MTSPPTSRNAVATMRETLESFRRRARHPMKSWDSGRVIDAQGVEDDADDALAALHDRVRLRDDADLRDQVRTLTIQHGGGALTSAGLDQVFDLIDAHLFGADCAAP